jgi:phosphatidylinositol kinase/protein kinase (PI-3  family)
VEANYNDWFNLFFVFFSTLIILHCDFLWCCRVRLWRLARCPVNKLRRGYDDYMGWSLSKQSPPVKIISCSYLFAVTCLVACGARLVWSRILLLIWLVLENWFLFKLFSSGHHGWATSTSRSKIEFHMGIQRSH